MCGTMPDSDITAYLCCPIHLPNLQSEGYWDDGCLVRFLEGVCWQYLAYPVCMATPITRVGH